MALFRRPRLFKPNPDGSFAVRLTPEARQWVVSLADQLESLLETDTDDTRRLFPTAYPHDPERDAAYQLLGRNDLVDGRREAIAMMRGTVESNDMTEAQLSAWMTIVNDLRLVLGTRLDVSEDETELDENDPDFETQLVYHELGMLVSEIVDALTTTLPEPDDL